MVNTSVDWMSVLKNKVSVPGTFSCRHCKHSGVHLLFCMHVGGDPMGREFRNVPLGAQQHSAFFPSDAEVLTVACTTLMKREVVYKLLLVVVPIVLLWRSLGDLGIEPQVAAPATPAAPHRSRTHPRRHRSGGSTEATVPAATGDPAADPAPDLGANHIQAPVQPPAQPIAPIPALDTRETPAAVEAPVAAEAPAVAAPVAAEAPAVAAPVAAEAPAPAAAECGPALSAHRKYSVRLCHVRGACDGHFEIRKEHSCDPGARFSAAPATLAFVRQHFGPDSFSIRIAGPEVVMADVEHTGQCVYRAHFRLRTAGAYGATGEVWHAVAGARQSSVMPNKVRVRIAR